MTGWLKLFTLSLFSDDKAKESVKFGFGNILLTSILSVVFIFLGIFAGGVVPFAAYYNGSEDFREFLYNAFGTGISVTVNDGKAEITLNGEDVNIDTIANGEDGAVYSINGYNLFVNSAYVTETYDDFDAYCVSSDGKTEINYEEYLSLNEAERKNYRFAVRYSGKIKNITSDDVNAYTAYLQTLNDEEINSKLKAVSGTENYNNSVYALYVQSYYPEMSSVAGESVPTLRTYYYRQTLKTDGRYFCLFGDMIIASFKTYNGNKISYGGIFKADNLTDGNNAAAVDKFIKDTFYGSASMMFLIELMNSISVIAFTELIIVGVMLLGFAVCRLRKKGACLKFADSARIVSSYAHIAALITAILTLCLSFAFGGVAVSVIAYVLFAAILIVRTAILLLREKQPPITQNGE